MFPPVIPHSKAGSSRVTHPSATKKHNPLDESSVIRSPFDLHVLSTPPAFILSQDQTLNKMVSKEPFDSSNHLIEALPSFKEIFRVILSEPSRAPPNNSSSGAFCLVTLFNLQGACRSVSLAASIKFTTSAPLCQELFSKNFRRPNCHPNAAAGKLASWFIRFCPVRERLLILANLALPVNTFFHFFRTFFHFFLSNNILPLFPGFYHKICLPSAFFHKSEEAV